MLIDHAPPELLILTLKKTLEEKARRKPIHSIHRWWSRRYSAIYRFLLASYLTDTPSTAATYLEQPHTMRPIAQGKVFYEPFVGGGTGVAEAALAGWTVYGTEINPLARDIAQTTLDMISGKYGKEYFQNATRLLQETYKKTADIWLIDGATTSYTLITRGKAPTWISTRNTKNPTLILLCPRCHTIFQAKPGNTAKCPICGKEFTPTTRPTVDLPDNLPQPMPGWKAFALQLRPIMPGGKPSKKWVSLSTHPKISRKLDHQYSIAKKQAREAEQILTRQQLQGLKEARRLAREAGIHTPAQLYTPRQLATYLAYTYAAKHLLPPQYHLPAMIAMTESAKSACIAARWHPPIGEPVPAAAMKTYWIPTYTAETNPIAHIPGTLRTLARNTIASSIRKQLRAYNYIHRNGGPTNTKYTIQNTAAENYKPPQPVHLAVVDPPYIDRLDLYTSLSIAHYAPYTIYKTIVHHTSPPPPQQIEKNEVSITRQHYFQALQKTLQNTASALAPNGRIAILYNTLNPHTWKEIAKTIKTLNLHPTAIYWLPGETPGTLARSKLRGLHIIILSRKNVKTHIVYTQTLQYAQKHLSINVQLENQAHKQMLGHLGILKQN